MTTQIKAGVIAANAITATELASSALSGGSFTGDVTFDTNTLVIDSTNNVVGIGTDNPTINTLTITGKYLLLSDSQTKLGDNGTIGGGAADGNSRLDYYTGKYFSITQSGTDRLVINSSGNVGIGTSSPTQKLDVNSGAANTAIFRSTGGNPQITATDGTVTQFAGYTGGGNAYSGTSTAHPFAFITSNIERMRIDTSGNVGIGTTAPHGKLHIVETASGAAGVDFPITLSSDRYQADYALGIAFRPENQSTAYKVKTAILASGGGYGYNQADLHFCLNSNNSTSVEVSLSDAVMTLKKGGNVGIGTSSPDARLDIHMSDSNGTYGRGFDGNLNLENTNTSVTEGGWMSISGYTGNAANSGQYMMGAITGGKQTTAADGDYGGYLSLWTTSGGAGGEANSGMYERMRIDSTGNIIVRTTTANSALSSIQALSAALQLNTPGVDDKGGHIFMTQLAAENTWMNIVQCHDDGATGVLFLIHGVRTIDQNRSYGALVRYAYSDTFNVISVNQQNTTIEYRVSGNALQYRFTSAGPYVVNLSVMAAG